MTYYGYVYENENENENDNGYENQYGDAYVAYVVNTDNVLLNMVGYVFAYWIIIIGCIVFYMKYFEKPCNNYFNEQQDKEHYDRKQRDWEIEENKRLYSDDV